MTAPHDPVTIYTDGSCPKAHAPGAWAFVVVDDNAGNVYDSGFLPGDETNQRAEMWAVLMALRWVKANGLRDRVIIIRSDSMYVINGLLSQFIDTAAEYKWEVPNGDLWKRLAEHKKVLGRRLQLFHVKGHSGDTWNEQCDRMAARAYREGMKQKEESK